MNRREAMAAIGTGALVTGVSEEVLQQDKVPLNLPVFLEAQGIMCRFVLTLNCIANNKWDLNSHTTFAVLEIHKSILSHVELDQIGEELTRIYPKSAAVVVTGYVSILDQERFDVVLQRSIFHVIINRRGKVVIGSKLKYVKMKDPSYDFVQTGTEFVYNETEKQFNFWSF
jgi:hypothetical protein